MYISRIAFLCVGFPALFVPVPSSAEHRVQKYEPGAVMTFTLASQRLACRSLESVSTMSMAIRRKFEPERAMELLWKPLRKDEESGTTHIRDDIMEAVPSGIVAAIREDCIKAPSMFVLREALSYEVIDNENELVLVKVSDVDEDVFYTWLFNIEILEDYDGD